MMIRQNVEIKSSRLSGQNQRVITEEHLISAISDSTDGGLLMMTCLNRTQTKAHAEMRPFEVHLGVKAWPGPRAERITAQKAQEQEMSTDTFLCNLSTVNSQRT